VALTSSKNKTFGYDAVIPLNQDTSDLFYELHKTLKSKVQQNLRMLLYTSPGERIMIPNYGVGLKRFLFEQSPEYLIDDRIRQQVSIYLPEITITSLNISRDNALAIKTGATNNLSVELIYVINGTNVRDSLIVVDELTKV
tara:strand:- start:11049 stop:11471 length:423 start_codon:yes stop_codon:yes gene_type:complete